MPVGFAPPVDPGVGYFYELYAPIHAVILGLGAIVIEAVVLWRVLPGLGVRALRDSFVMNLTTTALGFLLGLILPSFIFHIVGVLLGSGHDFGQPPEIDTLIPSFVAFTIIVGIPSVWLEGELLLFLEPRPPARLLWGATVLGNIVSHVAVYAFYIFLWFR